jgi:hypothetical protein
MKYAESQSTCLEDVCTPLEYTLINTAHEV